MPFAQMAAHAAYASQLPTTKPVVIETILRSELPQNGNIFSEGRRFSAAHIQKPLGLCFGERRPAAKARY
jgi:hypothetical protein